MNDFDRGESIKITVTLTDGTNNLDTSNFNKIEVKVSHKHLSTELDRFSLADSEVTKETPTSDGQISFVIPQSVTATAALGVYKYQVKTEETDTDCENNTRNRTFVGDCFYLKKALT